MLIDHAIDTTSGLVKDNATPALAEIRSRLRGMSGRVNSILRRVLSSAISQGWLEPDTTPAVRDGRLVIPVPPMNKRKIQGIVHDESASGKTLFIEPAEVVGGQQPYPRASARRTQGDYTHTYFHRRPASSAHSGNADGASIIYHLDFINAKAPLCGCSRRHYAQSPRQRGDGMVPCLSSGTEIVTPNDITVKLSRLTSGDKNERILVISGPNAGGKSVCLKTVGTLQYMLQCGILPPVYDNHTSGVQGHVCRHRRRPVV